MKTLLLVGLLVFGCFVVPATVQAGLVEYRWSGTIVKEQTADPWNVGDAGKPFALTVLANQAANEAFGGSQIPFADFLPISIAFQIDGVAATSIFTNQFDVIGFNDDSQFDQVSVSFVADFNGVSLPLGAAARILPSTFAFLVAEESPPIFGTAVTSSVGGGSRGSLYGLATGVGIEVSARVVPEPSAISILVCGSIGLLTIFRRPRLLRGNANFTVSG